MWKVIGMSMLLLAGQAYGSEAVGCKARQQAVKDQLVFAKAHGNADQVAGLERALRNIETHCTDAGLFKEQQQRVAELKEQVNERLVELQMEFNQKRQAFEQDNGRRQSEERNKILTKVQAAIDSIAKSNGYDLVLERNAAPYAASKLDISAQVISQVSKSN